MTFKLGDNEADNSKGYYIEANTIASDVEGGLVEFRLTNPDYSNDYNREKTTTKLLDVDDINNLINGLVLLKSNMG